MLTWGPFVKYMKKNRPRAWTQRPKPGPRALVVIQAANDLASSRTENGIPFAAAAHYAKTIGINVWWLWDRLRAIDKTILEHHEQQRDATAGSSRDQKNHGGARPAN